MITFSIKSNTPLKVEAIFKKLDKTRLTYYLAPRVTERDFNEEGFDDDEEEVDQDQTEE